jgi:DNA polymerase III epsilon subunit-like protein
VTTIQTHNGRVITPEKEISLTAQLIPQHIENFPFADARRFAQKITSGAFKGKVHFFALDFETTGLTRKELPRILEISIESIPESKLSELIAPPVPEGAAPSNIDPQSQCSLESPTATDTLFYSLVDPGIPSSIYAYTYHQINRSDVRGKPTMSESFTEIVKWASKFGSQNPEEDLFVFVMPHFAKMEKITLAYELSRANLEAPKNWVFVNATNILEKNLPFLDKIQLDHIYSHLYGVAPQRLHRADADTKTVKECLAKVFPDAEKFKDAVYLEMSQDVTKFL